MVSLFLPLISGLFFAFLMMVRYVLETREVGILSDEVIEYRRDETIPGFAGYPDCIVDVILVRKRCGTECESGTGSGSGGIPDPDDVRAVRLID